MSDCLNVITFAFTHSSIQAIIHVMEDTGCGIEQAMEQVYKSPLIESLQDEENELYVQSLAYLYEMMKSEIEKMREQIQNVE